MRISNELQIGKAGEYMVCSDLILKGFVAFISEQGLPYDVLLDTGKKILRVQVKTTLAPRIIPQRSKESLAYIFNVKRNGKNNRKRYEGTEIDLFALVCLDTKSVGYIQTDLMPDTINIRVDSLKGTYYDEKGLQDFTSVCSMRGKSLKEISKKTGLHISTVSRMLQDGYKPYETGARYFSDFERSKEWFYTI